jgi:hypothetical protein
VKINGMYLRSDGRVQVQFDDYENSDGAAVSAESALALHIGMDVEVLISIIPAAKVSR